MKQYDSIQKYTEDYSGKQIIAFDKLDGSNLRFSWNKRKGFYKFGTRKTMIPLKGDQFSFAIDLFLEKYAGNLESIFNNKKYKSILSFTCFAELIGTKCAFGQHDFKNDSFDIVLFDVDQYKNGFVRPNEFIDDFGHVGIPRVIYNGPMTNKFKADINNNKYKLSEGVICKGIEYTKKGVEQIFQFKLKTFDWLERLKSTDKKLYEIELKESY